MGCGVVGTAVGRTVGSRVGFVLEGWKDGTNVGRVEGLKVGEGVENPEGIALVGTLEGVGAVGVGAVGVGAVGLDGTGVGWEKKQILPVLNQCYISVISMLYQYCISII